MNENQIKAEALRETADMLDAWHTTSLTGDRWDNGFLHAVDMLRDRADELERGMSKDRRDNQRITSANKESRVTGQLGVRFNASSGGAMKCRALLSIDDRNYGNSGFFGPNELKSISKLCAELASEIEGEA